MDGVVIGEPGFLIGVSKSHAITSSNIFEIRNFLRNKDIEKWKIRNPALVWFGRQLGFF